MNPDSLLPNFPPELAAAAFRAVDEVAWPPMLGAKAVEWFGLNGFAVLGTELWLLKGEGIQSLPVGLSGTREIHGNTVDRGREEAWSSFVTRAAEETCAYLKTFKASDIVEQGQVYFNVVWVSEEDFERLSPARHMDHRR